MVKQEVVKNAGDGTAILSNIAVFVSALNPLIEFAIIVATLIWFIYRIQDLKLAKKLKQKELDKHDS